MTYDELMLVMVLAVAIPLLLALFPRVPIPASVDQPETGSDPDVRDRGG